MRITTITGAAASTKDADGNTVEATDEEKEAAKTAAKTAADNMLAAYQADPSLAAMRLDFTTTLRETLEVFIAGLFTRKPVCTAPPSRATECP